MINKSLLETTLQFAEESGLHDNYWYAQKTEGVSGSERYCFATMMVLNVYPEAEILWDSALDGVWWAARVRLPDGTKRSIPELADELAGLTLGEHGLYEAHNSTADLRKQVEELLAR